MAFDDLSAQVIGAAIEVHRALGPGLLESAYECCLGWELQLAGIAAKRQVALPLHYKGVNLDCGYRVDLWVADALLVEVKAVDKLMPVHEAQLLTYLKLSGIHTGLLINFHERLLRDGLKRFVL